jgi:hypothetical protein
MHSISERTDSGAAVTSRPRRSRKTTVGVAVAALFAALPAAAFGIDAASADGGGTPTCKPKDGLSAYQFEPHGNIVDMRILGKCWLPRGNRYKIHFATAILGSRDVVSSTSGTVTGEGKWRNVTSPTMVVGRGTAERAYDPSIWTEQVAVNPNACTLRGGGRGGPAGPRCRS